MAEYKNEDFWGKCAAAISYRTKQQKRGGKYATSWKKVDPDLPFYYWCANEDRYQTGPLPSFNAPSKKGVERLDRVRISRRADPGVFHANCANLPQRGTLSVRAQFHNRPEPLPPPPIRQM
ncbi:uncharacterized protein LOC100366283 [Saccoglossus kowalevskii]|uniref:Uncharacterized protein LOC100366283 n=1 Tax=Saccoglossus kowalevskii TaxID=10224 RepID=A0ABM0GIM5_SACKO|nr:PREDICTED: uncharacterized protein LOC100366283 [Saccoglossus kowalevskii]